MNYVSWFIVIYFIASYIRLYPKNLFEKTIVWGLASLLSVVLSVISIIACLRIGLSQYYFIADSNKILAVINMVLLINILTG